MLDKILNLISININNIAFSVPFFLLTTAFIIIIAKAMTRFGKLPYTKQESLFTHAEKNFLKSLDVAVRDKYRIFGKVRIADVLKVTTNNKKGYWRHFVKISSKHLDYVLVDPSDLSIVAAIELDDSSHNRKDRQHRDIFVDKACADADLPLIRIKCMRTYDIEELKSIIDRLGDVTSNKERIKNNK